MDGFEIKVSEIMQLMSKILKDPTVPDIQRLDNLLQSSDGGFSAFSGRIFTGLLLPLVSQIDSESVRSNPEVQWHLIATLELLLGRIIVDKEKCFSTILLLLMKQLYDFKSGCLLKTSEELKSSCVKCTRTLIGRTSRDVIEEFITVGNRKFIANLLYALVQIVEQESFGALKLDVIECILSFLQIDDSADREDIVLRSQIADVIYFLLPRILKCLMGEVLGNSIQGHQLIAGSIKAIGRIICLVFEKTDMEIEEKSLGLEDFRKLMLNHGKEPKEKQPVNEDILKVPLSGLPDDEILRTKSEWIDAVDKKLKPYLVKLLVVSQHKHEVVRWEVFSACEDLLRKCSGNLTDCNGSLLQIVFAMSFDEDEELSRRSRDFIEFLKTHTCCENFYRDAEAIIHVLLLNLPQSILREDDYKQILGFSILHSALDFIPEDQLLTLVVNELFLGKLSTILLLATQLDTKNPDLLSEIPLPEDQTTSWRKFKWLMSKRSEKIVEKLCSTLNNPNVNVLVSSHLLRMLEQRSQDSNSVLQILIFMAMSDQEASWLEEFFQELLVEIHWNLSLQFNSQDSSQDEESLTIDDIKYNVIHSCLVLEGVGICSAKMGSAFHSHLFETFHRVFAKASSSNTCVRRAALSALSQMKTSFGTSTIEEFLSTNADYNIFYINKYLRKSYMRENVFGMLQMILEYSSVGESNRFHLETILEGLLEESLKTKCQETLKAHFGIYQLSLVKMLSWRTEEYAKEEHQEEILQKWLDILHQKEEVEIPEGDVEPEEPQAEEEEANDYENEPKEAENIPNYVDLADRIVRVVSKYISSKDQELCLLSLELLTSGIGILTPYENKLHPVVHLIWFPLAEKFKCENPVILRQCFNLLCLLAKSSQDFIHRRTIGDVMPTINKYLTDVAKKSPSDSQQGMYRFSQEFKLIHTILTQYGQLMADIQMEGKNLDTSINCALLFLEKKQHEELQKVAFDFCKSLLSYDAPTIYLKLHKYPKLQEKLTG